MTSNMYIWYYFLFIYLFYIINAIMERRRRSNNRQENQVPPDNPTNNKPQFWVRFNNVSSIIIGIVTIFGFGYGTAFVVCSINHKMEIIELNAAHQKELEHQQKDYDKQILPRELTVEEVKLFIDNYNKNSNGKK